jgi:hypothetical protein
MIHAIGHASGSQIPQLKKSTDPDFCFTSLIVSLKMYLDARSRETGGKAGGRSAHGHRWQPSTEVRFLSQAWTHQGFLLDY